MTDAEVRKRILAVLYAVWKERGFDVWVSLSELASSLPLEPVAIQRNADLLAKLGLLERLGALGGFALYRISAQGVLECEQKGIQPDPVLLRSPAPSGAEGTAGGTR